LRKRRYCAVGFAAGGWAVEGAGAAAEAVAWAPVGAGGGASIKGCNCFAATS
jgi:hypothetical protein